MSKLAKYFIPLALLWLGSLAANAQTLPGKHPGYLHSLSDLRAARWFLYHQPGDPGVTGDEDVAISEIDAAIGRSSGLPSMTPRISMIIPRSMSKNTAAGC